MVVKRRMIQLWFACRRCLEAAARFCSGFLIVNGGTFNTNTERLPLLIVVGVMNLGKIFPVCSSLLPQRVRKSSYKKAEIEGEFESNKKITSGLADYSWRYIKSLTIGTRG